MKRLRAFTSLQNPADREIRLYDHDPDDPRVAKVAQAKCGAPELIPPHTVYLRTGCIEIYHRTLIPDTLGPRYWAGYFLKQQGSDIGKVNRIMASKSGTALYVQGRGTPQVLFNGATLGSNKRQTDYSSKVLYELTGLSVDLQGWLLAGAEHREDEWHIYARRQDDPALFALAL